MKAETTIQNIDYRDRLGGRRGERQILIKFMSLSKQLEVLKNKRNLAGPKVRVDEDFATEARRIRKELVPYKKKRNSVALVRPRTIPTKRPPLLGEISDNFSG
jgi:hypothetical protein